MNSTTSNVRFAPLGKSSTGKSNITEWKKNLKLFLSKEHGELGDAITYEENGVRKVHPDYTNLPALDYPSNTPPGVRVQRDEEFKAAFKRVACATPM